MAPGIEPDTAFNTGTFGGEVFTCNVCGAMYEKFVPDFPLNTDSAALQRHQVVAGYGENIICPRCFSTARERLIIAYLNDNKSRIGNKVLHLSPEKHVFDFLKQTAQVSTADLEPGLYKYVDLDVSHQDATRLTYPDSCFDLVIASHVLEHIPDDTQALRQIYRVMKPGAIALLQVPYSEKLEESLEEPAINDSKRQSALFGQKDHVRIYALADYVNRVRLAGLEVRVLGTSDLSRYLQFATQPAEKLLIMSRPV